MKIFPLKCEMCLRIQRMLFSAVLFCKLVGHLIASAGVFLSLWWAPRRRGLCPFQLVPSGECVKVNNAVHSCTNTHQPSAGLANILVFSWNSFYMVKWFPSFCLVNVSDVDCASVVQTVRVNSGLIDRADINNPALLLSGFRRCRWVCGCKLSPALLEEVKSAGHWARSKHVSAGSASQPIQH